MSTTTFDTHAWNTQAPHETALQALKQLHWPVLPIGANKKPPVMWKRYQTRLPTLAEVNVWERKFHPSAWAIITGALSSRITLEFDGNEGRETLARLGLSPHRQSGSGGLHVDFQHPGWYVKTLNHVTSGEQPWVKAYPGMDIRGDGGYIAFCGRNKSGPYTWLRSFNPDPLDLLPEDLRRWLCLLYSPFVQWGLDRVGPMHGRDNAGFALALQLRDNRIAEAEAESIMREYARRVPLTNTKGQYEPFSEEEAVEKLHSAYTKDAREAWTSTTHYQSSSDAPPANGSKAADLGLCNFDPDDAGNGDAMYALFGQDLLYCSSRGWLAYTGTHWQLDQDGAIVYQRAVETLRRRRLAAVVAEKEAIVKCTRADQQRVNGCVNRFKTLVSTSIDAFDREPDLLNCKNGVVDLRTGKVTAHRQEQRFTYCIPVDYAPADCAEWLAYLAGVVGGGQEVIDYLQMALGYSLTGQTREEILFYLYGPLRSGKGTIAEVFMALLPHPLSTMVDFNSFTAKREGDVSNFDLAPLKPSRLIFASESNRSQSLNPAKVKQLTGGDHVNACFKHKDFFNYRPQFKVWMMSNHTVNGDPEDDALWGRVRVIEFPNSFLGREDKSKKARLKEPVALQAILYWAMQGAIKWYALGAAGLGTPLSVEKITKAQRAELDYVQQWLDVSSNPDATDWVANEDVMKSYAAWCKNNNVQYPKGTQALSRSLKAKGYEIGVQKKVDGKNKKGVIGPFIYPVEKGNGNDE